MNSLVSSCFFAASWLVLAACSACSKKAGDATPPSIVDRGTGPTHEIAFATSDKARSVALDIKMIVGVLNDTISQHDKRVAPVKLVVETGPDRSSSPNPLRGSYEIVDVTLDGKEADPELYKQWQEDLGKLSLKGFKGAFASDEFGRVTDAEVALPRTAPSTVRQLLATWRSGLELFSVPRPQSAVGLGAVIKDERTVTLSGMKLDLKGTYTLVAVADDRLAFDADLTLNGRPQAIDLYSAKDDTSKASLYSSSATARGRITVPRRGLGPLEGELHLPVEMDVGMLYQGKESRLKSTIDLTLKVTTLSTS